MARQKVSSSRACLARRDSRVTADGSKSRRRRGINSWRIRARVREVSRLVASSRQCLSDRGEKIAHFLAPQFQERANDHAGDRIDSRQTRQTSAPQEMRQDGFGLIVRRVGHGNAVQAARFGDGSEKLIAQPPRRVFHIPAMQARLGGNVGAARFKFHVEFRGERLHEAFIFVRFRPTQLMVKMQNKNRDPKLRPQLGKNSQHRHRIRPARNSKANAPSRPDHAVLVDRFQDPLIDVFVHHRKPLGEFLGRARLPLESSPGTTIVTIRAGISQFARRYSGDRLEKSSRRCWTEFNGSSVAPSSCGCKQSGDREPRLRRRRSRRVPPRSKSRRKESPSSTLCAPSQAGGNRRRRPILESHRRRVRDKVQSIARGAGIDRPAHSWLSRRRFHGPARRVHCPREAAIRERL